MLLASFPAQPVFSLNLTATKGQSCVVDDLPVKSIFFLSISPRTLSMDLVGLQGPSATVALPYSSILRIRFATTRQATVCKECMEVDEELTDKSAKVFSVDGTCLVV